MNASIEKKATSIRLNNELYEFIKLQAEASNRSLNNYIETLLFQGSGFKKPNRTTANALEEATTKSDNLESVSDKDSLNSFLKSIK